MINCEQDYDIWGDADGAVCVTQAEKPFVGDSDAPYGYEHHLIRLASTSKRSALKEYRTLASTARRQQQDESSPQEGT